MTVILTVSLAESAPSLAVSLREYTPPTENVAIVLAAVESANVTVPGPLALFHRYVNAAGGFGRPSSVADPLNIALRTGTV